jgi:hypothetical protein
MICRAMRDRRPAGHQSRFPVTGSKDESMSAVLLLTDSSQTSSTPASTRDGDIGRPAIKCRSRHDERYDALANAPAHNSVAGHRLDDRPVLPEQG